MGTTSIHLRVGRRRALSALAAACCALALASCGGAREEAEQEAALRIVVTLPPLAGLAAAVAPEGSNIVTLLPPGVSEHGFELTPSAIAALGRADVVVLVGMGLETRVERALRERADDRRIVIRFDHALGLDSEGHAHHHEHTEDCDHSLDDDPHLWLDPTLVERFAPALARGIAEALDRRVALTDSVRTEIEARAEALAQIARDVDDAYAAALESFRGAPIVTHHDAYGRIAHRYGLEVAAVIRLGEGSEPTPGSISNVARLVRERGVGAIFVEPQFSRTGARRISEATGARLVPIDPLGDGDWEAMMRSNLASLVEGLRPERGASP
ncbi:MAG: zinc ABC transporter substrate-binding protein [Phycisphaerales bacterium]|nr:MAG: zinc ABC transporter substrate-binding protein [Phycisphaerales bacterium]